MHLIRVLSGWGEGNFPLAIKINNSLTHFIFSVQFLTKFEWNKLMCMHMCQHFSKSRDRTLMCSITSLHAGTMDSCMQHGHGIWQLHATWTWDMAAACNMDMGYGSCMQHGHGIWQLHATWTWDMAAACNMDMGYGSCMQHGHGIWQLHATWTWDMAAACNMDMGYGSWTWDIAAHGHEIWQLHATWTWDMAAGHGISQHMNMRYGSCMQHGHGIWQLDMGYRSTWT